MTLLLWIVIGAMAGWAMGEWMPNSEFGVAGHIMIGIIGALFGGYCFDLINMPVMGSLVTAFMGAAGFVLASRAARFETP